MNTGFAVIALVCCGFALGQTLTDLDTRLKAVEVTPQQFAAKRWYSVRSVAPLSFHRPIAIACYENELYAINGDGRIASFTAVSGPWVQGFSTTSPTAMTFLGDYLWVANGTSQTVTRIQLSNGQKITSPAIGPDVTSIENDGANIWATTGTSRIVRMNPDAPALPAGVEIGTIATQLVNDGTGIWAMSSTKMVKINSSSGPALLIAQGLTNPKAVVFDGMWLWVIDQANIVKIDPATGAAAASFALGMTASTIFSDGQTVYVADTLGTVKRFRQDGVLLGSYPVANGPIQFGFDGATVWIADFNGNAIFPKF